MALTTVSSDRLSTNVKNTNFTSAEKQDLTNDILPLAKQFGQSKNLIINGAMQVAQRGTSSVNQGYSTVDRFTTVNNGLDEGPTREQADVASGTPYTLGFRKSFKTTNGNNTGGAGAADYYIIRTRLEAQDIANSGWNYTSSSSYITLSFWVKSSVAQNFYGYLRSEDGTLLIYPFETGSLTADTWTKVTKTIPGNASLTFDNNSNLGLDIDIAPFLGTDFTGSVSLNTWAGYGSGATRTPDYGSANDDWYLTNDATFEITGVQLEVSSVATDFEHRSFGQELALCQRYFQKIDHRKSTGSSGNRYMYQEDIKLICPMRTAPSLSASSAYNSDSGNYVTYTAGDYSTTTNGCTLGHASTTQITVTGGSGSQYHDVRGRVHLAAEL